MKQGEPGIRPQRHGDRPITPVRPAAISEPKSRRRASPAGHLAGADVYWSPPSPPWPKPRPNTDRHLEEFQARADAVAGQCRGAERRYQARSNPARRSAPPGSATRQAQCADTQNLAEQWPAQPQTAEQGRKVKPSRTAGKRAARFARRHQSPRGEVCAKPAPAMPKPRPSCRRPSVSTPPSGTCSTALPIMTSDGTQGVAAATHHVAQDVAEPDRRHAR